MLLDTHVVVWWLRGEVARFPAPLLARLRDPGATLTVSAVVVWEMAIKTRLGKLTPPVPDLLVRLEGAGVRILPISGAHADRVRELPLLHRDPFDRLLVAQSQIEGLPLVTGDAHLARYNVEIAW